MEKFTSTTLVEFLVGYLKCHIAGQPEAWYRQDAKSYLENHEFVGMNCQKRVPVLWGLFHRHIEDHCFGKWEIVSDNERIRLTGEDGVKRTACIFSIQRRKCVLCGFTEEHNFNIRNAQTIYQDS